MLKIVQLTDGCYKVTIEYSAPDGLRYFREWTFVEAESDADEDESGERIIIDF